MARRLCLVVALLLVLPAASFADAITIGIGAIYFETGTPGSTNTFRIANNTGPLGAFSAPPDFPAINQLTFVQSKLKLVKFDNTEDTLDLGNIGPGDMLVEVLESDLFLKAIFTATLSDINFQITNEDGTVFTPFTADSLAFSAELLPSGETLTPYLDLVPLTITGTVPSSTTVPEPSSVLLLVTGLIGLITLTQRSRRNPRPQCTNGT